MPWTAEYYPVAMRNLPNPVRLKAIAIAIANALLAKRMPEDHAIRIAIAQAKRWAYRPGILP